MINAHILDGVALTKFIYWIKKINKSKINEVEAQENQKNLEEWIKFSLSQLIQSQVGKNGAIVHYRAKIVEI